MRKDRSGRSSGEISSLQSRVEEAVRRTECVLAALGVQLESGQGEQGGLDYSNLWSSLQTELSDPELRETLRTGLQDCHRTVQCLHQTGQQNSRLHLKKSLDFLQCFESKKTEACVKKNIKRKLLEKLRWLTYLEP